MHRSEAEGRFGEGEPAGRASVCARTITIGVFTNTLPLKTPKTLFFVLKYYKVIVSDVGNN